MNQAFHIVVAMKPLEGTFTTNCMAFGTGALNIDGARVATTDSLGGGGEKAETSAKFTNDGWRRPWMEDDNALERQATKVRANVRKAESLGRFPANIVLQDKPEVLRLFPQSEVSGAARASRRNPSGTDYSKPEHLFGAFGNRTGTLHNDKGSAARFYRQFKGNPT